MAGGTHRSAVDSRASDGAVAKTKSSASAAGNQNPALRPTLIFSLSHPSFKEKREVLYLTALAFCWLRA